MDFCILTDLSVYYLWEWFAALCSDNMPRSSQAVLFCPVALLRSINAIVAETDGQ